METNHTDETLRRQAMMEAMKLMQQGLDPATIYARLERQGFPEELAREIAKETQAEQQIQQRERQAVLRKEAWIVLAVGVGLTVASAFAFPGYIVFPVGLLATAAAVVMAK